MNVTLPIESASDTAFLTAYCRALESERPDAHFRDPHAQALAGSRGAQLLRKLPAPESTACSCIVRTYLLDRCLLQACREHQIDTILNLGSGLDARPYRLPLEPALRWIEVDSMPVLEHKAAILASHRSTCSLELLPLDLSDAESRRSLFHYVAAAARNILTLTEGLLIYLPQEQVASLARDLHSLPQYRCWLTDLVSPLAFPLMRGHAADAPGKQNIQFHFAPDNGPEFFRPYGWAAAECHSCVEAGHQLNRRLVADALCSVGLFKERPEMLQSLYTVVKLERVD